MKKPNPQYEAVVKTLGESGARHLWTVTGPMMIDHTNERMQGKSYLEAWWTETRGVVVLHAMPGAGVAIYTDTSPQSIAGVEAWLKVNP